MSLDPVEVVVGVALVVVCVVGAIWCVALAYASQQCLAAGWPRVEMDYTLTQYCIKRVDQTDVVKPLKELKP